jgi:PrtD family type I secretion system ABC transporter
MTSPTSVSLTSPARRGAGRAVRDPFALQRSGVLFLAGLSGVINLLMLTGPIFMMQVYDRVLSSRSVVTLLVLLGMVLALYGLQAVLDGIRSRVATRIAAQGDAALAPMAFAMAGQRARMSARDGDGMQPLRDLDTLRQFAGGAGPIALCDLPWTPIYLIAISLFHPVLGMIAAGGAAVLFVLTLLTERFSHRAGQNASEKMSQRNALAETGMQDAETLGALGIFDRLGATWATSHAGMVRAQVALADRAGSLASAAKGFRFMLQSGTLAAGAWLVIQGELSAGSMMATSVLSSRALAPIEQVIAQWRGFSASRAARGRLRASMALLPKGQAGIDLPPPVESLQVSNLQVVPVGGARPLLAGVSFALSAGDGLGVIGPSGAGKTTLLRGLLGIWPVNDGAIRLDGATPDQWQNGVRGFTGYLPQETRLLPGTIAENIAGFDPAQSTEAVLKAAQMAGVHEMILALPEGYNCRIGATGTTLSAGQRQRLALARAVYGDPFLVVMDEPNAHLDAEGDTALAGAIAALRAAGQIVICIAHRPSALKALNMVLMIEQGRMRSFGPKDEVLGQVVAHPRAVQQ